MFDCCDCCDCCDCWACSAAAGNIRLAAMAIGKMGRIRIVAVPFLWDGTLTHGSLQDGQSDGFEIR